MQAVFHRVFVPLLQKSMQNKAKLTKFTNLKLK